jgi:hydrogenase maturation protease
VTDPIVVIGYGNELRRDDAAGPLVARAVAARKHPRARALAVHQLAPELAEVLAGASIAIFVDAAATTESAVARPILDVRGPERLGHTSDPAWLLGLTEAVYGCRPTAWLVTLPAADLGHGKGLSPTAKRGVRQALELVEGLIARAEPAREERSECASAFPVE